MELVDLQSMQFYSLGIRFLVGLDYFLQSFMLKKFGFLLGLVDLLSRFPILETSFSQGIYFFFLSFWTVMRWKIVQLWREWPPRPRGTVGKSLGWHYSNNVYKKLNIDAFPALILLLLVPTVVALRWWDQLNLKEKILLQLLNLWSP